MDGLDLGTEGGCAIAPPEEGAMCGGIPLVGPPVPIPFGGCIALEGLGGAIIPPAFIGGGGCWNPPPITPWGGPPEG